jgi:hypothetical protein
MTWRELACLVLSLGFLLGGFYLITTGFIAGDQLRVTNGLLMLILIAIESLKE